MTDTGTPTSSEPLIRPEPQIDPLSDLAPAHKPVLNARDLESAEHSLQDGRNQVILLAPGESLPASRPGDFLLVKGIAPLSFLIRLGERLRHCKAAAQWSHAALIVGQGTLCEAQAKGILYANSAKYDNRWRALVRVVGSSEMRANAMRYAESCICEEYGFVDFASVALSQLFGLRLILTTARAQICSEFVANALERLGYIFPASTELETPADLYEMATTTTTRRDG
jgi:hypothetical protein